MDTTPPMTGYSVLARAYWDTHYSTPWSQANPWNRRHADRQMKKIVANLARLLAAKVHALLGAEPLPVDADGQDLHQAAAELIWAAACGHPRQHITATAGGRAYLASLLTGDPSPAAVKAVVQLLRDDVAGGEELGEYLGCPDCTAGEPHVCPFLVADQMPEPRRSVILQHIRQQLDLVDPQVPHAEGATT